MREFALPDVGEGVAEGEIVQWLVAEGDTVEEDQPVAEVETDKALVELPSPVDGVVHEIRAEVGDVVPVGEVIIVFEETDETDADTSNATTADDEQETSDDAAPEQPSQQASDETSERVFAAPRVRRLARERDINLEAIEGSGEGGRITEADVEAASGGGDAAADSREGSVAPEEVVSASDPSDEPESETPTGEGDSEPREQTLATPSTRALADELGVDLDRVPASDERDGEAFVTAADVQAFADAERESEATDAVEPEDLVADASSTGGGEEERIPYRGLRRTIGEQMERSVEAAPHVTHHDEADASRLVQVRESLKPDAEERGVSLTYMPFVMKAVVEALQEYPDMNAELDEEAGEIVRKHYYNLGIAVATDAGLMVPVVENVDEKGLLALSREVADLAAKARDRSIAHEEMQGGTFTITNFGAIGGEYATPIINYPEMAILGLGAIRKRPRVVDDDVVPRHTLPLSLSIDHRVVDGAVAARFANSVIAYLEEPTRLFLD